ncbi:hypothetical protein N656DRAFT_781065 [Canariomyces notabilis]|uniref:Uncharacterized protein n=1 Tax=Canariomyces notabilis TaxID=2074819 RepID=A0AAN6YPS8_9PEZI|nr:hypothetical protein N656DRAFT_781065 [Canariomyces arenarius]
MDRSTASVLCATIAHPVSLIGVWVSLSLNRTPILFEGKCAAVGVTIPLDLQSL